MKSVTMVVAMARNGAIGMDGRMPWYLPADFAHFKKTTMGKPIVMGRKTFESIGKPLPGRQNIVVTRNSSFAADGCDIAESLEHAIEMAIGLEIMVIGGGQIYEEAIKYAQRIVLTLVDCEPEADTWFAMPDPERWEERNRTAYVADERNEFSFEVIDYLRI